MSNEQEVFESSEVGRQTEINKAIRVVKAYYHEEPAIHRIQELVRNNEDFFNLQWGDGLLWRAADKLEQIVERWNKVVAESSEQ